MVVVGQSVTLPVSGLAEGSTQNLRVPYIHQILILIQVAQRVNFLIQMVN